MSHRLCSKCGHTDAGCSCGTPGWGRKHLHEFKPTSTIGDLTIERCSCGQVRHVVIVDPKAAS